MIEEDVLVFLREAPGESVLVYAARAKHTPFQIPKEIVGSELVGLAGTADIQVGADGMITLSADGPAFRLWRLTIN
jgi:alpha-glucosidase